MPLFSSKVKRFNFSTIFSTNISAVLQNHFRYIDVSSHRSLVECCPSFDIFREDICIASEKKLHYSFVFIPCCLKQWRLSIFVACVNFSSLTE
jgi:hypothetical protein